MAFLIFPTEEEAKARSAEAWEAKLGRKKKPEDVTEFLWGIDVGKDGRAALDVGDQPAEMLGPHETLATVDTLDANWEKPRISGQ